MIVVIDCGVGNLMSIKNCIKRQGHHVMISSSREDIKRADKLILPGVGAFKSGIENLERSKLIPIIENSVFDNKVPILGICLGMQLFTQKSEEGNVKGLGWLDANTVKFNFGNSSELRIPHIGWNSLIIKRKSKILDGISSLSLFYFVHSYHVICSHKDAILAMSEYGYEFVSVIQKGNIYGTQFHPEKSHDAGAKILRNFINI